MRKHSTECAIRQFRGYGLPPGHRTLRVEAVGGKTTFRLTPVDYQYASRHILPRRGVQADADESRIGRPTSDVFLTSSADQRRIISCLGGCHVQDSCCCDSVLGVHSPRQRSAPTWNDWNSTTKYGPSRNPPIWKRTSGILFISGKVALDDGTMLPDRAAIQTICKGRTHIEGYTDSRGLFSFQVTNPGHDEGIDSPEDASDSSITMRAHPSVDPGLQGSNPLRNYYKECQLQAALPGFSSGVIELSSKFMDVGNSDVGNLILHRMRQVQGLTISITTAQAPSKAKRQFEKGRNLE